MEKYINIISQSFSGYFNYLLDSITHPNWHNYFYWLLGLSLIAWGLEILFPWRKNQAVFRKDFWLDAFYLFFNFFLFDLIAYNAISNVGVELFSEFLALFGIQNLVALKVNALPVWLHFIVLFLVADFIQWNVHRLLHKSPTLWKFHKVHHSVKEMGFAAHLRFHWMESIVYKTIQYIPLTMLGFGLLDLFVVHIITIAIGHLNHSNLNLSYGPLKYLINNPKMHIWHHAKKLPENSYGVNFGISLSLWDYLFGTDYIPSDGRDVELGFENDENYPDGFVKQIADPFSK